MKNLNGSIKIILSFGLLFCTACIHAKLFDLRHPAESGSNANPEIHISDSLKPDLKKLEDIMHSRIVLTDRDLVTFNYQADQSFNPSSMQDVQNRLKSGWAEKYFDINSFEVDQGPGQYVAMDPFSSRWYGRTRPQLFVITIAKDSVILDVTKNYRETEQAFFEEMYQRLNCAKPAHEGDAISSSRVKPNSFEDMIGRMRTSGSEVCRSLIIRSAQDLGIQGILYNLESVGTLKECRHNRSQAINIIRHDAIRLDELAYYNENIKIEGKPIGGYIARLYHESALDPDFRKRYKSTDLKIFGSLKDANVNLENYTAWKRNKIYRCGPPWFSESQSDQLELIESLHKAYFDPDLLEKLAKLNDAFANRFVEYTKSSDRRMAFDLARLNQIEKFEFEADSRKNSLDFEKWKKESDSLMGSDTNLLMKKLIPWMNNFKSEFNGLKDFRSSLPEFYSEFTLNPSFARIRVNSWITSLHGIPFLVGALPLRNLSKGKVQKLVQSNKKIYLNIIQKCTSQYEDTRLSNADIQNGPCGIRQWPRK